MGNVQANTAPPGCPKRLGHLALPSKKLDEIVCLCRKLSCRGQTQVKTQQASENSWKLQAEFQHLVPFIDVPSPRQQQHGSNKYLAMTDGFIVRPACCNAATEQQIYQMAHLVLEGEHMAGAPEAPQQPAALQQPWQPADEAEFPPRSRAGPGKGTLAGI